MKHICPQVQIIQRPSQMSVLSVAALLDQASVDNLFSAAFRKRPIQALT
jgi:hypothetical protein